MTTSAEIRTVWDTYVFNNSDILAITDKSYPYELTQESEKEVSSAYTEADINFFEYVVSLEETIENQIGGNSNNREQRFLVEVRYTKYAGTDGAAFNDVIDTLEALIDVVREDLGSTWQNTVDFVDSPIGGEPPQLQKFNETDCYRAVVRFSAIKQVLA
jgi:tRNA U34 5-carboxymethylaminomethyl modifying GTPase MnmE/TrmE